MQFSGIGESGGIKGVKSVGNTVSIGDGFFKDYPVQINYINKRIAVFKNSEQIPDSNKNSAE